MILTDLPILLLLSIKDGDYSYIICPQKLKKGDEIISSKKTELNIGNCLELRNMPTDTLIHNIELKPGKGADYVDQFGDLRTTYRKRLEYAQIKLSSGEIRLVRE